MCAPRVHVCGSVCLCAGTRKSFVSDSFSSVSGIDWYVQHHVICMFIPRRCLHFLQFNIFARLPLLYHVCITPSLKLSSNILRGSHGTSAVAHQALPFVAATGGASVCVPVGAMFLVMFLVDLGNRNEHTFSREIAQGAGRYKPTLPRGFKKTTAQPRSTLQEQQRYNSSSTTAPAPQTMAFVTATVLLSSYVVCSVRQEIHAITITFTRVQL